MRTGKAAVLAATFALAGSLFNTGIQAQSRTARHPKRTPTRRTRARTTPNCGDVLAFQVLLDRAGFSPGEIDGRGGPNLTHTIAAFQSAHNLAVSSKPDCATWNALQGGSPAAPTISYTVSEDDVKGPFTKEIPQKIAEQSKLPALGYRSPLEAVAEKFHAAPALLTRLNRGTSIAAGKQLTVPNVDPFDPAAKPLPRPDAAPLAIQVSRDDSALRAIREDGSIAFFAPVTSGSEHDPLPIGEWHVTSIQWHPVFHYNPDLFWDAKATDERAAVKPGPNNPVGVVWIGIDKEHYGLHGTPEPGRIGHSESHGCVRLTNWDAARVASFVGKGSVVVFK